MIIALFELIVWVLLGVINLSDKDINVKDMKFQYTLCWVALLTNIVMDIFR